MCSLGSIRFHLPGKLRPGPRLCQEQTLVDQESRPPPVLLRETERAVLVGDEAGSALADPLTAHTRHSLASTDGVVVSD